MEVTYLRLDPIQPETDIFNEHMSQQIVYSSINQYGADVIIPKTLPMKLNGITLGRNQFWSDNVPDLIVTTMRQCWSNDNQRFPLSLTQITCCRYCSSVIRYIWKMIGISLMLIIRFYCIKIYTLKCTGCVTLKNIQ